MQQHEQPIFACQALLLEDRPFHKHPSALVPPFLSLVCPTQVPLTLNFPFGK